jgi:hypothetical protein
MKRLAVVALAVGGAVLVVGEFRRLRSSVSTLRDAAVTLLRMNR